MSIRILKPGVCCRSLLSTALLLTAWTTAWGERLPLRAYTTSDGLAHNIINKIFRDSRGFLWFGTNDGLSRFDGYTFTNYGTAEGLPHPTVNDIVETREGDYWVATNGGLCKFNLRGVPTSNLDLHNGAAGPAREPMFTVIVPSDNDRLSRAINRLLQDRAGRLWCGTAKGLYRLEQLGERVQLLPVDIGIPSEYAEQKYINALLEDRHGTLWIGAPSGLYRRLPDGSTARYGKSDGLSPVYEGEGAYDNPDFIHCLLEDRRGNLWVGTAYGGLFRLEIAADHRPPVITRAYTNKNGLTTNWVFVLYESTDGKLWVGTNKGLGELTPTDDKATSSLHFYTEHNGLSFNEVVCITGDRDGNLWLGTNTAGAMTLARNGFTTFDKGDWVNRVTSVFESSAGDLYAFGQVLGDQLTSVFEGAELDVLKQGQLKQHRRLGRFDGQQFSWLLPDVLKTEFISWSDKPLALQSRTGEWWIGTSLGLYQFPSTASFAALKTTRPIAVYKQGDGLAATDVYCLYEDRDGNLWVATVSASIGHGLARWDHATRTLHDMAQTSGLPSLKDKLPTAFQEDKAGNLWVGFNQGELARYRDGRFTVFTNADGLPLGRVNDLYLDHAGRLWIAMMGGALSRVDDPIADQPVFTNYTIAQGLSGNFVSAITEDTYGRIYVGTGQGLDRLDPVTGRIKHYTTADGLAPGHIAAAFRARDGQLWFGTAQGLSRFWPEPPQASAAAPPILLTGLHVAGTKQNISANGETDLHLEDLAASGNQLQIDFVGLSFAVGESLRYQYRLEGADADWSAPNAQRAINYANLAPGRYRFLVRALSSDGGVSWTPATITFNVRPHFWQRWWFLALGALAAIAVSYSIYRYRIARVLEVANLRTRIATDLHDDIGANLTKIAILSEVARQQRGKDDEIDSPLSSIASISRDSVASMSDIVWAINPKRDSLQDLVRRMRRHAEEIFTTRDIGLEFRAPGVDDHLKLGVDVRRDLFLIFKEAVNNVARHSRCSRVEIDFRTEGSELLLRVSDNGAGFDPDIESEGQGLTSMRRRASARGGSLEIKSNSGGGTTTTCRVPIGRHARVQ